VEVSVAPFRVSFWEILEWLLEGSTTGTLVITNAKAELAKAGIYGGTIGRAVQQLNLEVHSPNLIIAARVPDDLYRAIRPVLSVTQGRLIALSTPFGQRGWFFDEWTGAGPWQRVKVTWQECPRITNEFVAEEERAMGRSWVAQEYERSFEAMEGLVYPDFAQCVVDMCPHLGKPMGGIDGGGATRSPPSALQ
jgi:hypothetical protein